MRLHCDTLSTMNFFSRLVKLRLQIGSNRVFLHGLVLTHKIHKNGFYVIVKAAIGSLSTLLELLKKLCW